MVNLAAPWMLLLIPLPFLIRVLLPVAKQNNQTALTIPFFDRISTIKSRNYTNYKKFFHSHLILPLFIWCLLCFAASGPQWLGNPMTFPQSGRDLMLVLDLSGSMQTSDMKLNDQYLDRLSVVKIAARKFIKARVGDRLGLVLFGPNAYLQTPLTFDQHTVLQMLNDATIGLAGSQTAMGDGLGLAIKQLANTPGNSKVIVLLTDGGNNAGMVAPLDAAAIAKQMGIQIYTIGIGANEIIVPGLFGPEVIQPANQVDEDTLKKIANLTDGLYFRADSGNQLQQIYQKINRLVPVATAGAIFRPIKPLYPWPLGLALLLSCYMVLRKINFFSPNYSGESQ